MKWYNIRFHNLSPDAPADFRLERSSQVYKGKTQLTISLSIQAAEIKFEEKLTEYNGSKVDLKNKLLLNEEKVGVASISKIEIELLYRKLRELGFLYFELEDSEVSFDDHQRTNYSLRAHGANYTFVDATESPVDSLWERNLGELDFILNQLADRTKIIQHDVKSK